MTQEEKDLLLKDLCARLPYGVIISYDGDTIEERVMGFGSLHDFMFNNVIVRPYLRPMSSMTEEEKEKYCKLQDEVLYSSGRLVTDNISDMVEWLNSNHFDWRGLIEKGLALEAPEGMYNLKE